MTSDIQKLIEGPTETAPALVLPDPTANSSTTALSTDVVVTPTQLRRPWRAAARTFVQTLIPTVLFLGLVVPQAVDIVLEEAGESIPASWRVALLAAAGFCSALAAIFSRIMALPAVEALLQRTKLLRGIAAAPAPADERQTKAA